MNRGPWHLFGFFGGEWVYIASGEVYGIMTIDGYLPGDYELLGW